jgi:phosphoribosylformimino-5-aminoimidazole carboxamide ribotide isomerase
MAHFTPIPAVDIRGGRCVRLVQGDFSRETRYADDPAEMARHWERQGAQRLHVVDLDGARDGVRANAEVVQRLLRSVTIPVQVGGGVRSMSTAAELLDQRADRVVVGTRAAEDPAVLAEWVETLGADRLIVGVDARDGHVATRGWVHTVNEDVLAFCERLAALGVRHVVYTDVARDGLLTGPDIETTRAVARILKVIGSGGVATLDHLRALAEAGAEGAIVGTALYEGKLALNEALAVAC